MNFVCDTRQAPTSDAHAGILAIRTFGGACPEWAQSFQPLTEAPTAEIIIVRDAPNEFAAALSLSDTPETAPPLRIVVVDEALPAGDFKCPDAIWIVSAPAGDLDAIAEANMRFVRGPIFIGLALADVMELAGTRENAVPRGRGAVVLGMYGDEALLEVRRALQAFAEAGFENVALIHAIATGDDAEIDLYKMDKFASELLGDDFPHEWLLTGFTDAAGSAWIVIGFAPESAAAEAASSARHKS